jgi:PST family polysaccharide transporter
LVAWSAFFWAVAQSLNLSWYFQGLEQMKLVGVVDVVNRLIITLSIFVLIHGPQDAWRVLALQGVAGFLTFVAGLYFAYQAIPWRRPTLANTQSALSLGWRILVFRIAETAYTGANSFVLGLFAPSPIVGLYAGAEKIARTCYLMLEPFSRAVYIRVNHVLGSPEADEARLLRLSTLVMGGAGFSMGAVLLFGAPWIVRILLGNQYAGSVPVLRLMAILPFCIALKNVLGFHCMLPRRMERELNTVILWSGVFHVACAGLLVPRLQQYGMATAAALTETFIVICIYLVLRHRNCLPWSRSALHN